MCYAGFLSLVLVVVASSFLSSRALWAWRLFGLSQWLPLLAGKLTGLATQLWGWLRLRWFIHNNSFLSKEWDLTPGFLYYCRSTVFLASTSTTTNNSRILSRFAEDQSPMLQLMMVLMMMVIIYSQLLWAVCLFVLNKIATGWRCCCSDIKECHKEGYVQMVKVEVFDWIARE